MSQELSFYNELEELIDSIIKSEKDHVIHGLLVFNLDNFAHVNENLGMEAGDMILDIINDKIGDCFKGTDVVAKLRGDEYAVLIRNLSSVTDIEKLCEKMLRMVSGIEVDGVSITSSIGVAVYPFHGNTYKELKEAWKTMKWL